MVFTIVESVLEGLVKVGVVEGEIVRSQFCNVDKSWQPQLLYKVLVVV